MNSELEKIKGPVEYIKKAWGIYFEKENFVYFAKIMVVLVLISNIFSYALDYYYPIGVRGNVSLGFVILSLISFIIGLWFNSTTYYSLFNLSKNADTKSVLKLGFSSLPKYLLLVATLGAIVVLGIIFLVIPGIIFSVWFGYAIYLVLEDDKGLKEAFAFSKKMVKGRFFKILGRNIIFGFFGVLVTFMLSFIPVLGPMLVMFLSPLVMLPFYLLYKDILVQVN